MSSFFFHEYDSFSLMQFNFHHVPSIGPLYQFAAASTPRVSIQGTKLHYAFLAIVTWSDPSIAARKLNDL